MQLATRLPFFDLAIHFGVCGVKIQMGSDRFEEFRRFGIRNRQRPRRGRPFAVAGALWCGPSAEMLPPFHAGKNAEEFLADA